jgi:hypothetical protein
MIVCQSLYSHDWIGVDLQADLCALFLFLEASAIRVLGLEYPRALSIVKWLKENNYA